MKKFIIDEANLNVILDYLAQRPFKEVAQAINFLSALKEHKEEEVTAPVKAVK